ncbi:MAG TPA: glycosyltransferase family 9 protein, partial [Flavobacteriaceae bacterium]|nr:glycosyltransferase family 9 protein [Flavobacteriaceae bacterium]
INQIPKDWDVFSYYCPENQFHKFKGAENKNVVRSYQDWSMLCYVVSKRGAEKLFKDSQEHGIRRPLDHHIFYNKKRYKTYTIAPKAARGCERIEIKSTFQEIQKSILFPLRQNNSIIKPKNSHYIDIEKSNKNLGNVLIYKSYGGLGDIFFSIPAIYSIVDNATQVTLAVEKRLLNFFKKYLTVNVIDEETAKNNHSYYDTIYELGNYPPFKGYNLPYSITYPTHKKVKQHAINHYLDALENVTGIKHRFRKYPYFDRKVNATNKYYTIHPGAGFKLKIWPTGKFAKLIEEIATIFPSLKCKIIQGPDDPDIIPFFQNKNLPIELITGGMEEVGKVMEKTSFFIGNDAGITHVAGAFNIPTVGIYGPTGPGSWGSFSEHNELIWGKKGVCNIKCNYDVIMACEHKICLNSVTVTRVLEALYKVLQKSYSGNKTILKINPEVSFEFSKKYCIIKLGERELLLEYHTPNLKKAIENLFIEEKINFENEEMKMVLDVLMEQEILFKIPAF